MSYAQVLQQQRHDLIRQMQTRLGTLAEEGRSATSDEATELDGWEADIARVDAEYQRALRAESLAKSMPALVGTAAPVVEPVVADRGAANDGERLLALVRDGRGAFESIQSDNFIRALQSQGGSAIPETFADFFTLYMRNGTPMFRGDVVTLWPTPTGNPMIFPVGTADPNLGGTVTAEAASITEADPGITTVQLDSYKYAGITPLSSELNQDNVIGIQQLVARMSSRQIVINAGAALTTGNGSGAPNGIVSAAVLNAGTASHGTAQPGGDNFFGWRDLVDLSFGVAQGYRDFGVGKYMASTSAVQKMRKFRSSDGYPLFIPSLAERPYDTFSGYPVIENASMASVGSATKSVIFGDLSQYYVRRLPTRIDVSDQHYFGTDQIAVRVIERVDGDLIDRAAVAFLVSANT